MTASHDVFFSVFDLNFLPFNFDFDPDENFGRQLNDFFSSELVERKSKFLDSIYLMVLLAISVLYKISKNTPRNTILEESYKNNWVENFDSRTTI